MAAARTYLATRIAVLLLASVAAPAARAQDDNPFQRAAHLQRGVNLSMWYAQDSDYSAAHLAAYTTPADFQLIHELGFDHVRLSINPEPLIDTPPEEKDKPLPIVDPTVPLSPSAKLPLRPEAIARLDRTVQQLTAAGLVVVLDIHPEEPWKRASFTDEGTPRLLAFWRAFSAHFAATDPQKVYFEVLNEPENISSQRWASLQDWVVTVIRKQAPHHTIIVTGADWGGIDGLLALSPLSDPDLIYSFHDYDPMTFTHQGATWAGDVFKPLRNVPYPSTPENVAPLLSALPEGSRAELEHYGQLRWNITTMQGRIARAADWGRQNHVPVWCGEFGAYRDFAPAPDRARWIADMRATLEKEKIGWDMWDYQGAFALVTKTNGLATADPAILQALGLKQP